MRIRVKGTAGLVLLPMWWLLSVSPGVCLADDALEKEAMVYVITEWNVGCNGDLRSDWDDMVLPWFREIRNNDPLPRGHGNAAWNFSAQNVDGVIVDSDFVDPDNQAWGDDPNHADQMDAFMVGLHGGNGSNDHRWIGRVKWNEPGTGNCNAYQGHIELGDDDLEFLHLSSCYSMDREDWWNEWNSSFDGLHQIDGFHGTMYIDPDWDRRYRRFADDSFWTSIADSWLDHLYYTHWILGNRDQCPVARNVGANADDALVRLNTERYNHVLDDPPGLSGARSHRARYIRGCNPYGKEALPQ